jgi:hypothetical protein
VKDFYKENYNPLKKEIENYKDGKVSNAHELVEPA